MNGLHHGFAHTQRLVVNGMAKMKEMCNKEPQLFLISVSFYHPEKKNALIYSSGLFIGFAHFFGSIRMEPVFMVLGQSAGAAAMAIAAMAH
jgi:hypothetical protein